MEPRPYEGFLHFALTWARWSSGVRVVEDADPYGAGENRNRSRLGKGSPAQGELSPKATEGSPIAGNMCIVRDPSVTAAP